MPLKWKHVDIFLATILRHGGSTMFRPFHDNLFLVSAKNCPFFFCYSRSATLTFCLCPARRLPGRIIRHSSRKMKMAKHPFETAGVQHRHYVERQSSAQKQAARKSKHGYKAEMSRVFGFFELKMFRVGAIASRMRRFCRDRPWPNLAEPPDPPGHMLNRFT
jgi:hypothetical protein